MNPTLAGIPLAVAVVPLGLYLLLIGWFHLRRRPMVLPGAIDLALLAAGVSGLVAVGPLALVQPAVGTSPWATAMLLLLCGLVVGVAILVMRPRLVVYNATIERLRPVVAEVVGGLDNSARWAGETVALPARGLQVSLDGRGVTRSVSLVATGTRTSNEAWSEFARRVRRGVRPVRVRRNPWGAVAILGGVAILLGAAGWSLAPWIAATAARLAGPQASLSLPAAAAAPAPSCSEFVCLSARRSLLPCPSTSTSPPTRSPFRSS
ncbi:MAG: hypothetical protein RLZZ440_1404 [Planctomycetota bacterium]